MFKRKLWEKSAYRKVVLSLIAIMTPIFLVVVIIYQWGLNTLRDEITNSMAYQVTTSISDLETDFERVQSLMYDVLSDPDLNALANISASMNDFERVQRILRLQHRLNAIHNSNYYINRVNVFIPSIEKEVSSQSIDILNYEKFYSLKELQYDTNSSLFAYNNNQHMAIGYPFLSPKSNRELTMLINIEFSESRLKSKLLEMKLNDDEGFIFKSNSALIYTNEEAEVNAIIGQLEEQKIENGLVDLKMNGDSYITVVEYSSFFNGYLIKYRPESIVFSSLSKFKTYFYVLAIVSIIILMLYAIFLFNYIHKPLDKLVRAFRNIETGDIKVRVHHSSHDEFYYIYNGFNNMLDHVESLIDEVYKQKILMQKAELKHLQSQINPHFLYNSFFILNTMARLGDNDQLERFTLQLGEYFQFITRNHSDNVMLIKEVQHAKIYTEIQGMRFSNRVSIEFIEITEQLEHIAVPRLILQPLIENAFEHAIERKTEKASLRVKVYRHLNQLIISVEDNGDYINDELINQLNQKLIIIENIETTGIINIHQRIMLMFGKGSGLHFDKSEWDGLKATITINLEEE